MNRIMRTIARLLTPWRTIRQLERDVKRLEGVIANPYLAGLQIGRDTGIEVGCRGSGPQLLAGMFEGLLEKDGAAAPNYLELEFHTRRQGRILVHVQRLHGETPHAMRVKAEKKAAEWKAVAEQLVAAAELVLIDGGWLPGTACAGDIDSADFQHRQSLNAAMRRALALETYESALPQHRAGAPPPVHIEPLHFVGSDPADQSLQIADAVEPDTSGSTG